MKFAVTVKKEGGKEEKKVVEAESRFAVYDVVRQEGGTVVSIAEGGRFDLAKFNISIGSGVKRREIITFARNLSAMLNAGLSLSRALSVIERQSRKKALKEVAHDITAAVAKGSSFHEALAAHPQIFSKIFIAMARAGEESGGLSEALSVVALQMERSEELSRKIKGAMIYPSIVVTAIIIVSVLMLIFVVPTLTATFAELKVELPLSTQIIVNASTFMRENVILVFGLLVALGAGIFFFVRSAWGKNALITGTLFMPVIGELARETFSARASRTLASLLSAGVPMLSAIEISEEVVGTPRFAVVLAEAGARVKKGEPLSAAFAEHGRLFPIMMSDMISVGEETGKLAEMLKQVAEFYEADVSEKTKDLSTIIEPVLMLLIGVVVGVFAVSMIYPIYSLSSAF